MNRFKIYTLKSLRKLYATGFGQNFHALEYDQDPDSVSNTISEMLESDAPCMIARFGSTELTCLVNYKGIQSENSRYISYIRGESNPWWWQPNIVKQMQDWSGFFPPTVEKIELFCERMTDDAKQVDILGSWLANERFFASELRNAKKIRLMYLDPFWSKVPWTKVLANKKILVVHPFSETIISQYKKRPLLFQNEDILPQFKSLAVIKAVQSLGKGDDRFSDWFEALSYMETEIEKHDFDICLIGCGAYGFPLAAHVKRLGKKAVHLGGSLQLIFGIRGKRWEVYDPHYEQPGNVFIHYHGLPNEHWVRPGESEKPANHQNVEDSCYW